MDQDRLHKNDNLHSDTDDLDLSFAVDGYAYDSETDELGLRIAAHGRRISAHEAAKPDLESPHAPRMREVGVRLEAEHQEVLVLGRKGKENQRPLRERLERQQPEGNNKPREPFFRAKERRIEREQQAAAEKAKEDVDAIRPKQHVRAISDGHPPVDPPLNVPQGWGHRNRNRANWLRRSTTEGEGRGLVESVKRVDADTVLMHKTSFTGDDLDAPLSAKRIRQFSSPSSLHHMNTTLQEGGEAEVDDLDFEDASVLVSTPAVHGRNRKIDELMKEDEAAIEEKLAADEERQAVITQRQSRFALGTTGGDRPLSAPAGDNKPFSRRRRRSDREKEEAAIDENDREPRAPTTVTFKDDLPQTNGHTESIDLLRRLARVSSLSPSPAPDKVVREYHHHERRKSTDAQAKTGEDTTDMPTVRQRGRDKKAPITSIFSNTSSKPEESEKPRGPFSKLANRDPRRISSEPSQPKSALEAIVQQARSKRDANIGDSTIASLEDIVNPNVDNSSMFVEADKTATVEDTEDADTAAIPSSEETRRREEREIEAANRRLRITRTSIKDADRGLRRLGNQLESTNTSSSPPAETHQQAQQPDPPKAEGAETIKVPPEVQKIVNDLFKAQAAKHGLPTRSGFPPGLTPYTDHNGRTKCEHCGGCYASVWKGLWVEFREMFYTWSPTEGEEAKLKFTILGMVCAMFWGWMICEMLVGWMFGDYLWGVARFPFLTVGLGWRLGSEPIQAGKWVVEAVGNMVFGDSSTVAEPLVGTTSAFMRRAQPMEMHEGAGSGAGGNDGDWVAAVAAATGSATRRVVRSAVEAVDEVGGMWNDDYLNL